MNRETSCTKNSSVCRGACSHTLVILRSKKSVEDNKKFTRGDVLAKLAMAPIVIGALATLQTETDAASKSAKSAVQYVDKSPNGKLCSQCRFFMPAKIAKNAAKGGCQIVEGSIAPGGYCVAWAAKS